MKTEIGQPIKLHKNTSYPTYQLYATIANEKTLSHEALRHAVELTFGWLRQRFQDGDTIPEEIQSSDSLKSFRINKGFTVDVVYIKTAEKETWSLCIVEPDSGLNASDQNPGREPVTGRSFETNIAFAIIGSAPIECGINIVCVEPEGVEATPETFRPTPVKLFFRDEKLRLKQVWPIQELAYKIDSTSKVRDLKEFLNNRDRQIPFVIIAERNTKPKASDIAKVFEAMEKEKAPAFANILESNVGRFDPVKATVTRQNFEAELPFEPGKFFSYKASFAHFGVLSLDQIENFNQAMGVVFRLAEGDVRIFYPVNFADEQPGGEHSKLYKYSEIAENPAAFVKKLDKIIENYPRNKRVKYGNVQFLLEASVEEQRLFIDASNSKEELKVAYEKQIEVILANEQKKCQLEVSAERQIVSDKNKEIRKLEDKQEANQKSAREAAERLQEEIARRDQRILALEHEITRLARRLDRPDKLPEIPAWVARMFPDKMLFHDRATDLISACGRNIDAGILCDALEYLACEYRDFLCGELCEDDCNDACNRNYRRRFEVTPSGEGAIQSYPKQYKAKYGVSEHTGKPVERAFDWHLSVGGRPKDLIRIYFFYDNVKRLIVVGSLPDHLETKK